MKVAAIDKRYLDRGAAERAGGVQAGETAADDDDAVYLAARGWGLVTSFGRGLVV